MGKALILFAHGARAATWAEPFERLRAQTAAGLPDVIVRLAFLELMEPRLPALVAQLVAEGVGQATVVPVFLGQGGHVLRDLPLMVDQIRTDFPELEISVAGAVGEDPTVMQAMSDYCIGVLMRP
jgi:sirohydrochlorin cobaltochelatase